MQYRAIGPLLAVPRECADAAVPETAHGRIRAMLDYWHSLRPAPDRLPGRQHLDPLDIPALLPDVWLIDVVREGGVPRFRYRLQGTRLRMATGFNGQGRWFDEANPDFRGGATEAALLRCVRDGCPDWRRGSPQLIHTARFSELERVFLPLAHDGVTPDMILALTIFYDLEGLRFCA